MTTTAGSAAPSGYSFRSRLSFAEIRQRLESLGHGEWQERDSAWYGDYIRGGLWGVTMRIFDGAGAVSEAGSYDPRGFLVRHGDRVVGFALATRGSPASGVARVSEGNPGGCRFWTDVITEYTGGAFVETTRHPARCRQSMIMSQARRQDR